MATIASLPAATSPVDTDLVIIQQGASTRSITRGQLVAGVQANLNAEIATTNVEITDLQNSRLRIDGANSMTGALTLAALDPISDNHAARKVYVDTGLNQRLRTTGGSVTGALTILAPTADLHAATRLYTDTQRNSCIRELENYDPTVTGAYPVLYNSLAILSGAAFYITVAGTIGPVTAITLAIGDILIARVDAPTNVHADWAILQANTINASETAAGVSEIATNAEAVAKTATDRVLVASNLTTGNFQASATFEGLTEHSTDAEFVTGTAINRSVTPANIQANITDYQEFIGIQNIILRTAGTWTATVSAVAGDVFSRKTALAEAPVVVFEVDRAIRTAASRGFRLDSYSVVYKIATFALVSHTTAFYIISYADNTAATPTQSTPAITGTLQTVTNVNIRVTNISLDVPSFLNTTGGKHVISVTLDAAATTVYDIYGIILFYTKSGI